MTRGNTNLLAKDNLGYYVYEKNKITRFTNFHAANSPKGFLFNVMLQIFVLEKKRITFISPYIIEQCLRMPHSRLISKIRYPTRILFKIFPQNYD
jgi:hypothetical protein